MFTSVAFLVLESPLWLATLDAPKSLLELALQYVVAPAIPLIGAGLLTVLAKLSAYLGEKGKESRAARAGAVFADLVRSTVAHAETELRPKIQLALADGRLTPEEAAELRTAALEMVKGHAPADLKKAAEESFGALGLDLWLKGLVERAAAELPPSAVPAQGDDHP